MGKAERDKGARAEREVANIFRAHNFNARRGMVFYHEPDLVVEDLPGYHFEVKRHERLALPAWIAQAKEQAKEGEIPAVIFRQSRGEWFICLPLNDWLKEKTENEQ